MLCPICSHDKSIVTDSRTRLRQRNMISRRRECVECKHRWTTREVLYFDGQLDGRKHPWTVDDKLRLVELREYGDNYDDWDIGQDLERNHLTIAYKVEEMLSTGEYFVYQDSVEKLMKSMGRTKAVLRKG